MKRFATLATAAVLTFAIASPANATPDVHPEIEAMLAELPGGTVLSFDEAYWADLDMTMTVPNPFARSVGSCATGSICAYTAIGLSGTKLSWGTCATHTVPGSFVTRSVANARAAGSVAQARNGTTILASASSGTSTNVTGTTTNIRCLE
ncbi:hypothetical protein [Microbacterium sulfonylureivorans]|uniref:hypothetical protein n=1 Tax=Microbacterium sulfonylureivorans TaxID=2486854 RepID=UPI000FDA1F8C|nr:hypothetical protein [Microbacterium sulfonylureivorans]